ncbi:MAG: hypothetical protein AABZ30_05500 [Myxococcota bacterium]
MPYRPLGATASREARAHEGACFLGTAGVAAGECADGPHRMGAEASLRSFVAKFAP